MRLNKYIANNSKYSRRKADELIEAGKVFLNGTKVTKLGIAIDPENDSIEINNKKIQVQKDKLYFALHKPADYITSRSDEHGRQTVMDLLPKIDNLKPIGRLDKDTEGLLLLSNDGEFINRHTHPRFECEKEYWVKIKGDISQDKIAKLENGVNIDGKKTSPAKIRTLTLSPRQSTLTITIHEGRNRQIRKMFAQVNCPVKYLKRLRIGSIKLNSLLPGQYRKLTKKEIDAN